MFVMFQGAAADRFLDSLSGFINGLDTKNNVKVLLLLLLLLFHYDFLIMSTNRCVFSMF